MGGIESVIFSVPHFLSRVGRERMSVSPSLSWPDLQTKRANENPPMSDGHNRVAVAYTAGTCVSSGNSLGIYEVKSAEPPLAPSSTDRYPATVMMSSWQNHMKPIHLSFAYFPRNTPHAHPPTAVHACLPSLATDIREIERERAEMGSRSNCKNSKNKSRRARHAWRQQGWRNWKLGLEWHLTPLPSPSIRVLPPKVYDIHIVVSPSPVEGR